MDKPPPRARTRAAFAALACGFAVIPLAACAPTATVEAAPHADDPECADVMLALPEELGDFGQRETTSQGTSAWGDPSRVVLRCGVEPPGPQPEHCVTAEGVDWLAIEEEGEDDSWRLTSYGRDPAVEVLLEVDQVASSTVMVGLAGAMENVEQTRSCTSADQAIEGTEESGSADDESAEASGEDASADNASVDKASREHASGQDAYGRDA